MKWEGEEAPDSPPSGLGPPLLGLGVKGQGGGGGSAAG